MNEKFLSLSNISLSYVKESILSDISFDLCLGEIGCLLGSSGCGKTSLLRAIAGFEKITSGEIKLNNKTISSKNFFLEPEQRKIGMVFQDYSLFPHLSLFDNVVFGLYSLSKKAAKKRAMEVIEQVGLLKKIRSMPHELSGGEQQRVSLARALAPNPSLLLLDEPFSNLDAELRESLSSDIRDLLKINQTTALLVTHDQKEAFSIADSIGILSNGSIIQWGDADYLYNYPKNETVATFIGKGSFFNGKVNSTNEIETILGKFYCDLEKISSNDSIRVFVRPEDVKFNNQSEVKAKVINKIYSAPNFLYTLLLKNNEKIIMYERHNFSNSEIIGIDINFKTAKYFIV